MKLFFFSFGLNLVLLVNGTHHSLFPSIYFIFLSSHRIEKSIIHTTQSEINKRANQL